MKENVYYEEILKPIVQSLPEKPGCYQYLNSSGQVIYVGKAKNLKRRVSSYFLKEQQTNKTKLLVKQIADIKYIVTDFYNWDTNDYNEFKGIVSPHDLHELHKAGKAKEFMSYGEITYSSITWTEGQAVDQIVGLN